MEAKLGFASCSIDYRAESVSRMYASIVVFLLCVVQFASAANKVGGAPPNLTYNSKAFTGFAVAGCVILVLFVALSVYTRNEADAQKAKDAAVKAHNELQAQAAAPRGQSVASNNSKSESR